MLSLSCNEKERKAIFCRAMNFFLYVIINTARSKKQNNIQLKACELLHLETTIFLVVFIYVVQNQNWDK